MTDVIIPTWQEVNGCVFLVIAVFVFFVFAWIKSKKEDSTVKWIRDWEGY